MNFDFLQLLIHFYQIPLQNPHPIIPNKAGSKSNDRVLVHNRAENELQRLHAQDFFWRGHNLYTDLQEPTTWEEHCLLLAPNGEGKTALLTSLYYHQEPAELFTVYQSSLVNFEDILEVLVDHLLLYIEYKPTRLVHVSQDTQILLAQLLLEKKDQELLCSQIQEYRNTKSWLTIEPAKPQKTEFELDNSHTPLYSVREQVLNKLADVCLQKLYRYIKELPIAIPKRDFVNWIKAYSHCLSVLIPSKPKIRFIIDAKLRPDFIEALKNYESKICAYISFVVATTDPNLQNKLPSWQIKQLKWGKEDLERMFLHRLVKQFNIDSFTNELLLNSSQSDSNLPHTSSELQEITRGGNFIEIASNYSVENIRNTISPYFFSSDAYEKILSKFDTSLSKFIPFFNSLLGILQPEQFVTIDKLQKWISFDHLEVNASSSTSTKTLLAPNREFNYQSDRFVGRKTSLDLSLTWQSEYSSRRIMLITAPPKTGKSWFVRHLLELFSERGIACVFIDIKDHMTQAELTQEVLMKIVNELSKQLNAPPLNPLSDLVAHLEEVVVRSIRPSLNLIVFDGLDLVAENDWNEFQAVILNTLFRQRNLRFILTAREEFRLSYPLSKSTDILHLPAFDEVEARTHLSKLAQKEFTEEEKRNILVRFGLDVNYKWNHAGTNTFIYKCLEQRVYPFPVDDYLMGLEVILIEQLQETKELLRAVFSINKSEWTEHEFSVDYINLSKKSLSAIEIGQKMSFLMSHSLVYQVENKPRHFKVSLGISVIAPLLLTGE